MEVFNKYFLDLLKNKYADFKGRARRSEFWYFLLFYIIINVILSIIDLSIGTYNEELELGYLTTAFQVAVLVPYIAVLVRRMHDVGKSGWFMLIPIYNLILAATDGEAGTNEYGPNPKNPNSDDVIDHLVG